MKQTLHRELTNIVFLVLIVAAAVAIYLLSRAESKTLPPDATPTPSVEVSSAQSGEDAEQTSSTGAADADENKPTTRGVPESVFKTHLLSSKLYSAEQERGQETAYTITVDGETPIVAALSYELQNDCISSLEITFQLTEVIKGKSKVGIEQYVQDSTDQYVIESSEAIANLLADLLPASDLKGELQQTSIRFWTDQTVLLKKPGDKFEDTLDGYHFIAYRRQGEVLQELVLILYLT